MDKYDKYLDILEKYFSPKDFEGETIKDVAKQVKEYTKKDIDKHILFEVIHDRYEFNYCDDCGALYLTTELMWNNMGAVCTYCYDAFNENEKEAFDRLVEE